MANAYRMTITIPASVKEQMDQVKEPVNWSAVAAEAFRRKVVEIRTQRSRSMTREKVIERLRSAGKADPRGAEAGREFGRKWAEEKALPRQLRNLAKDPEGAFEEPDPDEIYLRRLSSRLANLIADEGNLSPRDFWNVAVGADGDTLADDEDFARGFVAGALEVWEDVKDDLQS
jgi:hypothetical protein